MALIKGCANCISSIAASLATILAAVIVAYTVLKLSNVGFDITGTGVQIGETSCVLAQTDYLQSLQDFSPSDSLCLTLEIVGGITIGLGIVVGMLQCCYICGGLLDGIFAIIGSVMWVILAAIVTSSVHKSAEVKEPLGKSQNDIDGFGNRRDAIMYMAWIEVVFFAVVVVMMFIKCLCCSVSSKYT